MSEPIFRIAHEMLSVHLCGSARHGRQTSQELDKEDEFRLTY